MYLLFNHLCALCETQFLIWKREIMILEVIVMLNSKGFRKIKGDVYQASKILPGKWRPTHYTTST